MTGTRSVNLQWRHGRSRCGPFRAIPLQFQCAHAEVCKRSVSMASDQWPQGGEHLLDTTRVKSSFVNVWSSHAGRLRFQSSGMEIVLLLFGDLLSDKVLFESRSRRGVTRNRIRRSEGIEVISSLSHFAQTFSLLVNV